MSGLLVGMCICCCICCIIYIGSCGYLLFMSESCSDINMYCDNQFAGDTAKVFKCKTYSNRINGILSTDVEKQMSDNEKKLIPNFDKYLISIKKLKDQLGPSAKISCIKKFALCDYVDMLTMFLTLSKLGGLKKGDENIEQLKSFYTTLSDNNAITMLNSVKNNKEGKGTEMLTLRNIAYGVKYSKTPLTTPILPSKFDRTIFIDLFDAFGM